MHKLRDDMSEEFSTLGEKHRHEVNDLQNDNGCRPKNAIQMRIGALLGRLQSKSAEQTSFQEHLDAANANINTLRDEKRNLVEL